MSAEWLHYELWVVLHLVNKGAMRRIELCGDGRLYISETVNDAHGVGASMSSYAFYVASIDDPRVDAEMRRKFYLLSAADEGVVLEGIGVRILSNVFWIYD